jgi:pilus assembly protein CpaB
MQARRVLIALITAVIISGLFTLWLGSRMAHARSKTTGNLHYVAPAKSLEAGEVLTADSVKVVDWPSNLPLQGSFTRTEDVVGKSMLYPVEAGEPILTRQLAAAGSGLSGRIPDGMRAISLKSNEVVGVAGYLLPGTRVDVLVTVHSATSQEPITSTVLQDAQVLTAGQKMQPDPDGKASRVDVVTLLVSPEDAESVVLASTQGTVHFLLRNGTDHVRAVREPARISQFAMSQAAPPAPAPPAMTTARTSLPERPRAPSQPHYTIQVRRGDKDTVETF